MRHVFNEILLTYKREQLDAWQRRDWSLVPAFHEVHEIVRNQPSYHFGEFFTFDHFHRHEGWRGFRFFVLGVQRDILHPRYAPGGMQLAKMIPAERLAAFRA